MARALVFTKQLPAHPDAKQRALQYRPGMVIAIIEDGQEFGADDIGDHARVIEFSGVAAVDLAELCRPQIKEEIVVVRGETRIDRRVIGLRMLAAKAPVLLAGRQIIGKSQVRAFIDDNFAREPAPADDLVIA